MTESKSESRSTPSATALKVVFLLALAVVAIVMFAQSRWFRHSAKDYADAVFKPQATTLAPGVHMLGELSPGAAYVIETNDGLVLIDTGLDSNARLVAQQISDLGLDIATLRVILITHVHADHSLGARRLRQISGAKICAGVGDRQELETGGPRDAFFSTYSMPDVRAHPTKIDQLLKGGETIDVGDTQIHCIATPGHTPGSICFMLERDGERILFTGDTVSSLTSKLGTYSAHLSPRYRASADDYLASLGKLKKMPAPNLIMPGHPSMDRTGQSPRLSETEWHALLDRGIFEMREAIGRFDADGRDFLDGEPKTILPGLYYLGEYHDWAVYCLIKDDKLFVFDAPGESGYHDFIRERLEQLNVEAPPVAAVLLTATDKAATGALSDLISDSSCQVVVRADAWEDVRKACPPDTELIEAESLGGEAWIPVTVIKLGGAGKYPVAYLLTWEGKTVLVSGRVPVRDNQLSMANLPSEIDDPFDREQQFLDSLDKLGTVNPHIWLPARPFQGQNANLYGSQWREMVSSNRQ